MSTRRTPPNPDIAAKLAKPPAPEITERFPIGETVQLRSGGHLMTVVDHHVEEHRVEVVWSLYDDLRSGCIPADALRTHTDSIVTDLHSAI
jgi:hypothetical protein